MSKLKRIQQLFFSDGEGALNVNRFMKKKQTLIGCVLLALLIVCIVILHGLSQKKETHHVMRLKKKTTVVDGVLSTDFTQRNEFSALEQQQAQMDRMHKELERLRQQTAMKKENKATHQARLMKEINQILKKREAVMHATLSQQSIGSIHPSV